MNKDEINQIAKDVAVEYIKKEENKEMVVTDVEHSDAKGSTTVFVNGHYKDKEDEILFVTINYAKDFSVESVGHSD